MRRTLLLLTVLVLGVAIGRAFDGTPRVDAQQCVTENGDVNGDGQTALLDAITLLSFMFLGSPTELPPLCPAPGIPDSQMTCYDASGVIVDCATGACAGQDGFYASGCATEGRFIDNGDGTVTDTCTGLMWQQGSGPNGTWCSALAYCEELELAGHGDWRMPNIMELQSITDFENAFPALDPVFESSVSGTYWTSTTYAGDPEGVRNRAWVVTTESGETDVNVKTTPFDSVRAVRNLP